LAGKIHVGNVLDKTPSGRPIPGGLQLILLDPDQCKEMVYFRLEQAIGGNPQGAYLHAGTDEKYARQILAEQKQRDQKGIERWVQVGRENHFLDCEAICQAVADPEWPGGGVNLLRHASAAGEQQDQNSTRLKRKSSRRW